MFGKIFFIKEINTFIQQGCIQLFRIYTKDIQCYNRFLFQILFFQMKNILKKMVYTILGSTTVFNTNNNNNNNKCLLRTKSAYENDFWRIIWH